MSTPGVKVGVSEEEKKLSYYKYFEQDLAPVPAEKIAILQGGPIAPEKCIPFEERNKFLKGEADEYANIGYGVAADGTGLVCNTTYMPGVTGEMLDWWFPWHSVGSDLRYKIWDPEDHYFARAYPASYVVDPNVPMNQKTWGVDTTSWRTSDRDRSSYSSASRDRQTLAMTKASLVQKTANLWSVQLEKAVVQLS